MKKIESPLISEAILAVAIMAALILLINPFKFIMTSALILSISMILAIALIAFGVFVWREQPRDEREALYGMQASRISYFLGAGVLVVAIIVQSAQHHLDVWLAVALGVMVLAKLTIGAWSRNR